MNESALDRAIEVAKILGRHADKAEAELQRANDELADLRRRNEKLERVALMAKLLVRFGGESPDYVDKAEVDVWHYYDLREALSGLDKEDAAVPENRGAAMLAWLHEAQQKKLNDRADHGDWQEQTLNQLWGHLMQEVDELTESTSSVIVALSPSAGSVHVDAERAQVLGEAVLYEAADVSNVAAMIADKARALLAKAVATWEAGRKAEAGHV